MLGKDSSALAAFRLFSKDTTTSNFWGQKSTSV